MSAPILITGATGNTGRVIATRLRQRGQPFVALARTEARRRQLAAAGIDAVVGDFDEPAGLLPALRGVERAYLVCTPDERLLARELAFIRAARRAGVRHIVKCSAFAAGRHAPTRNLRAHAAVEAELRRSGLEYTIVRPHGFMQTFTLLNWNLIQRAGAMSLPAGNGGIPLVDVRDVAEVVVQALTEPGHVGKAYDLTGPEVLDMYEQAAILSRALGRPIIYVPGRERQLVMFMRLLGVAPAAAEHAVEVFALQRSHGWERTTPTLHELGIPPTSFEAFVDDLIAGQTGGGSSFEPRRAGLLRLLELVMPAMMRLYLSAGGRRRAARSLPGAP